MAKDLLADGDLLLLIFENMPRRFRDTTDPQRRLFRSVHVVQRTEYFDALCKPHTMFFTTNVSLIGYIFFPLKKFPDLPTGEHHTRFLLLITTPLNGTLPGHTVALMVALKMLVLYEDQIKIYGEHHVKTRLHQIIRSDPAYLIQVYINASLVFKLN